MSWIGVLAVVSILAAGATGLTYWLRQREERRQEDFEALAARRGWSLTRSPQSLGRPAVLRLSARSGPGWQAEARLTSAMGEKAPQRRTTEWTCEEPRWPAGTLIIGPALADGDTAIAANLLHRLDDRQGRRMLQRLTGGRLGVEAVGLRVIDGPESLTVIATTDPKLRVDLGNVAKLLATWDPPVSGEEGHPILILSPAGLRLRLRHDTRSADRMEAFIDMALGAARIVG